MAFSYHPPRHIDGNYCILPKDIRKWEATEIAGISERGRELMEIAGREVAMHVLSHYPNTREILIFCGTGNNGGDGLVAAYYLERCGLSIHLFGFEDNVAKTPDAQTMFQRVSHLPRTILRQSADAGKILEWEHRRDILVIDGIFGTGYRPSHNVLMARIYHCIEQLSCPVVSIDIPSGIDAATGYCGSLNDTNPPKAIAATDTITFGVPKTGHFFGEGPEHCGDLYCVDIGLRTWPKSAMRCLILSDEYCQNNYWSEFSRSLSTHKGTCGHVVVLGGSESMSGAVWMACRSALRSGCGLVTAAMRCASHGPDEIMMRRILDDSGQICTDALQNILDKADVLVIGPGLGRDQTAIDLLNACGSYPGKIVLDADGLWALSQINIKFAASECFMTPHPAEAARLLEISPREVLYDPIQSAKKLAEKHAMTVILKSHATVIASRKSGKMRFGLMPYPNPAMATAGSGDVLAGILGGILAQARCGAVSHWFDAFETAALAVNCHSRAGRSAEKIRGNTLCAPDIIDAIRTR